MSVTVVVMNGALRLNDHKALAKAAEFKEPVLPVIIFPESLWKKTWFEYPSMGPHRQSVLHRAMLCLEQQINAAGGTLWASNQSVGETFTHLMGAVHVVRIIGTHGVGAYEKQMQQEIEQMANQNSILVEWVWDHTLLHPSQLPFSIDNAPRSFSKFRKQCEVLPIEPPVAVPPIQYSRVQPPLSVEQVFQVPAADVASQGTGGEAAAMAHLTHYIWESKAILHYKNTRNLSIGPNVSTKFSVWLSTGVVSPRTIAHQVRLFERNVKRNESTYWVMFELLWRDFFQFQCERYGMQWYAFGGLQGLADAPPTYNPDVFDLWVNGKTNEPFVNGHMNELRLTGYMSNRGRQVVASYLIHDCNQDWRRGAEVFEHYLVDYDVASNIGNWMYIAGCGNSATKRIFNIQNQQKKYDPGNNYVQKWLNC
jgi:deoxyribodipyrimidine photo-lyase